MKKALVICLGVIAGALSHAHALSLEQVLQKTVDKNPEIQRARIELERATGRSIVLHSVAYPDALVGAVGGAQGGYRAGESKNTPFGFGYGGFTQPLFNAAIPASRRRGDIEVLIAQQQLNMAVTEHVHAARLGFYAAAYNRSLQTFRTEQRARLQQASAAQKTRYEAGLEKRGVFVGAELEARELDARIETTTRAYQAAVLQDAQLMGDDLSAGGALPRLDGEIGYRPISLDLEAEIERALQNRADLALARLFVRAAAEDQRIMEAAYYPMVTAQVAGEYIPVSGVRRQSEGSPKRSDDFISSEVRAGAAYSWRVIDNGRVYGAVKEKKAAREINEILLHKMESDVPRELTRLNNQLQAIAAKQSALTRATKAADQSATTARENFAGGITSQLEVRLTESSDLETRSALLDVAYQQQVALAEWDRATGRYLRFSDDRR